MAFVVQLMGSDVLPVVPAVVSAVLLMVAVALHVLLMVSVVLPGVPVLRIGAGIGVCVGVGAVAWVQI